MGLLLKLRKSTFKFLFNILIVIGIAYTTFSLYNKLKETREEAVTDSNWTPKEEPPRQVAKAETDWVAALPLKEHDIEIGKESFKDERA